MFLNFCKKIIVPALLAGLCAVASAAPAGQFADIVQRCRKAYKRTPEISASIVDLKTGQSIYQYNASTPLMPASNQKILSGVFAAERLGQDFEFTTGLYLSDNLDLIVMGGFDPLLGDPIIAKKNKTDIYEHLDTWVGSVKSRLGGRVLGNIMMVVDKKKPLGRHPHWPDKQNDMAYQAPVSRLNFHDNSFGVVFDNINGTITPRLIPYTRFVKFTGSVRKGKRHIWGLRPNKDESVLKIWGKVKQSTTEPYYASCDDPAMLLGRVLAERLLAANVDFTGMVQTIDYRTVRNTGKLISRTSNSLVDVLRRANKESFNLAAESMLLRAGTGRWESSAELLEHTFMKNFNVPAGQIECADGCGLSRKNRVSASAITKILSGIVTRPYFDVYLNSLSISGTDGTLRRRMTDKSTRTRVRAKTGYIAGVSCLSGYVIDSTGQPRFAFSFLVNKIRGGTSKARKMHDDLCRKLVKMADEK